MPRVQGTTHGHNAGNHHGHPQGNHHGHPQHNGWGNHHGHHHHFQVFPSVYPTYRPYRRYSYYYGSGALLLCAALLIPALIISLTVNAVAPTTYAATSMALTGASAATGSALALSAATFGIGALVMYGAIGIGFLISSAKECYSGNKNVMDMIYSRVVNDDRLSVKGVLKSLSAVIWSPFLLVGGLAGMGVKAAVNACSKQTLLSKPEVASVQSFDIKDEASQRDAGKKASNSLDNLSPPVHTSSLFASMTTETKNDSELSQTFKMI